MHQVLARQMRRLGLTLDDPPNDVDSWKRFLERIEGYYRDADRARYLLERSLRVSSDELIAANEAVLELSRARLARSEAHYRELFNLNRVPTWEENFERVAGRLEEWRADGVTDLEAFLGDNPGELPEIVSLAEVVNVNPAVAHLVRSSDPEDLIGPIDPSLVDESNTPAWIAQLKAIWDGLGSIRIDPLVGHRLDGEQFHGIMEWHAPVVGESFDYSRVLVTMIDITERIEAEEKMQDILKSKDEFLASISHELRTPLTSVLGFAEVLRAMGDETTEEERGDLLEIIASQASDLSNIVEDLLVAARAELGQLTVVAVPVDVHAQIAQVMEGRSLSHPVRVPERPAEKVVAAGDPQRIRQILRNLITNAARYGGDHVFIEVDNTESGVVRLQVCDDGEGLDEELSEAVFERYYRHNDEEGQPGSVGIGLTISRELARIMGGDLFYTREGGLTVFTLELARG